MITKFKKRKDKQKIIESQRELEYTSECRVTAYQCKNINKLQESRKPVEKNKTKTNYNE